MKNYTFLPASLPGGASDRPSTHGSTGRATRAILNDLRLTPSPHDREIFALAIPAVGALAAEPLYVLANTAIVGHIGTTELAALAIAGTLLTSLFAMCNFLTYGTTAQVARLRGAGRHEQAARLGAQAAWLGAAIGVVLGLTLAALAGPLVGLMGGDGEIAREGERYLRISAIGAPFFLVALAGQGFLRGVGDLRTPLWILVASQVANLVLVATAVYAFDLGLTGSAIGTVLAQAGMGLAFAYVQFRAGRERPHWATMRPLIAPAVDIAIRTGSLTGSFLVASAVLARVGDASVAAHQIAFQLFVFLALVLDAIAIAGQVMVGRMLGAGDAAGARAAARRMIGWSVAFGALFGAMLLALTGVLPGAFTGDERVIDRAEAIWPLFAAMMPANGAVFALDGILIGAGDTRFLMKAMVGAAVVYIAIALTALQQDWGIVGVWVGLLTLIGVRLATLGVRFVGERWALTGAHA